MNILEQYKHSLKSVEVEEVVELYFYRPLAFLFVKTIYNTGITPNHITLLGMIIGISGGVVIAIGSTKLMVLAAFLFIIFNILDCSDGQLARLKGNGTPLGRIFDGIADYLVSASAYIGIGVGLAPLSINPLLFWGLLILTAASNVFHSVLVDYYRNRFLDYTLERNSILGDGIDEFRKESIRLQKQKNKRFERIVIAIYLKYSALQSGPSLETQKFLISPRAYYNKNKTLMHAWTYLGPATQWTFLCFCLFLNKIELYFWGLIILFNTAAFVLLALQRLSDIQIPQEIH